MNDPHDPYADLDTETLLDLLAKTRLSRVPGEAFEYSNFGAMLLTLAVTNRSGQDFDRLLEGVLFEPLGMDTAGVGGPVVQGHDARGKPVKPWTFNVNLAGVGGVRASLDDMIRFVQANLAFPDDTTGQAIARSHQVLASPDNQRLAWGWLKLSVNGKTVVFHNGGTAGMTAEVAIDPDQGTGVIILADTGLAAQGGFTDLALQLLTQSSR